MESEAAGFEQRPSYVVREVPEAKGWVAEVFEVVVDRFCRAVTGPAEHERRSVRRSCPACRMRRIL